MSLIAPQLDDRRFQDIVDETKKRIPLYCKEWTDHNVSDPGVTLIELFAWMTDIILYRLNQVPEKHYIKFMEMLGIHLQEPIPARVPITFWLSAPQEMTIRIPAGTEVASTQTEKEPSIVFTTNTDFNVEPPQLAAVVSGQQAADGSGVQYIERNLRRLSAGARGVESFSAKPRVGDALYFGFENDLSHHILGFETEWSPGGGAGINPNFPPLVWEASAGAGETRWALCDDGKPEIDTTQGMEVNGRIHVHLPKMNKQKVGDKQLYWVRVRVRAITDAEKQDGMTPYETTPLLRQVTVASWGGTTPAYHAQQMSNELLGQSDGSPGQRFQLQVTPVLRRQAGESLIVQFDGQEQVWEEKIDFAESRAHDPHFTLDGLSGEVRLGPAVRQPNGDMKLYGQVPPRDATLIFRRYRTGGGEVGNVQPGILNTLKTSIPFVARVSNRKSATGGEDAESLADAMVRAPAMLRSRGRAVTESDYEFLAEQAFEQAQNKATVGRVKCLQPRPSDAGQTVPGQVFMLLIPRVAEPDGYLTPQQLQPREEDIATLQAFLEERRLLTVRVSVRPPAYRWAAVKVRLRTAPGADREAVKSEVLGRLYRYLNPLTGGPDKKGWPFGRDLYETDASQALQGIANILFVSKVELYEAINGGPAQGKPQASLEVVAHGVVASGQHEVEFV